jgi:carbon starvation protein CstA
MISFLVALAVLVIGFFTYGLLTEKVFGPDDRKTPAMLFVTYVIVSARYIKTNEL